jgi:hypothetical protein
MALVKKLQPGGTVGSLDDELNKELSQYNLKSKDERKVRDALVQFRDYFATPEGKSFAADELAKKYTVTGQGSEKFAGSPDEVRANWFTGKLKIENDEDARSVAAAIYGSATKNLGTTTSTTPETKTEIKIGDLGDYVYNQVYGTEANFLSQFGQIKNDDERKAKIFEFAQQKLNDYKTKAAQNTDLNYSDVDKLESLQQAIASKDWDKFLTASNTLKWEPHKFLLTDPQKKQLQGEADAKAVETKVKDLETRGFSKDLATNMIKAGYQESDKVAIPGTDDKLSNAINSYIKTKGGFIWKDPSGKQMVTDKAGNLLDTDGMEFAQFTPLYGYAWTNDPDAGFTLGKSQMKTPDEGDVGKGLDIPKYYGWTATGWSRSNKTDAPATDFLNNRDYTKHIELTRPGYPKLVLTKDDKGVYHTPTGEAITDLEVKGYKPAFDININNYDELFPNIEKNVTVPPNYDYNHDIEVLKESLATREIGAKSKYAASALVNALTHSPTIKKNVALKQEILDLLAQYHDAISPAIPQKKLGGILKAQKGGYFSEYKKKMEAAAAAVANPQQQQVKKPMKDISGTWKDQSATDNTLDAISMAGTAASFIPGVGAIGAGVAMGADLTKDLQDGQIDDWGTHALNAGFVALSAIGLGGVKALVSAGKAAKGGSEFLKVGKVAGKYKTALKLADADVAALDKVVKLGEKTGAKSAEDIVLRVNKLKELQKVRALKPIPVDPKAAKEAADLIALTDNHIKVFEQGLETLGKVSGATLPKGGSLALGKVYKYAGEGAKKLAGAASSTPVRAAMMLPGLVALPATATTIWKDGIEYTKPKDISKILMAGAVGKTWTKDFKGVRALKRQLVEGTEGANKTSFKLGQDQITLNKAIEQPGTVSKKLWNRKSKIEAKNTKSLADYKEEVLKAAKEEGVVIHKGELDKLTLKDFQVSTTKGIGKFTLPSSVQATTGNRTVDVRDYDLAAKHWGKPLATEPVKVTLTADQKQKIKDLSNVKLPTKGKNPLFNKQLPKEVRLRKKMLANSKPNLVGQKQLEFREKQLQAYKEAIKRIRSSAKGGILKFATPAGTLPTQEVTTGPRTFAHISKPAGMIDFNERETAGDIFKGDNYKTKWMPKVEKAFADPTVAAQLVNRLENYTGQDQEDVRALLVGKTPEEKIALAKRLATDQMVGPYHYVVNDLIDQIASRVDVPTLAPRGLALSTKVNPAFAHKAAAVTGVTQVEQKPGAGAKVWNNVRDYISPTNVSNALMFANTYATNVRAGNDQRKAIANSLYQLPYMQHQYIRTDRPNTLLASKQAAQVRSQGKGVAGATSDLNLATAAQLQGEKQAQEIVSQGQTQDLNRFDKIRGMQLENNAQVDQYNTGVLGKNRGLVSEAFKNIHLTNANQAIAQNTNLNNYMLTTNKNIPIEQYKQNNRLMFEAMRNPEIKKAIDAYNYVDQTERSNWQKKYDEEVAKVGQDKYPFKSFEESPYYTPFQKQLTDAQQVLDNLYEPIKNLQLAQQYQQPLMFLKKGGSTGLTKLEKMELQRDKERAAKDIKETEMVYKAMMHNNEILQKALIRVFK